ncbi:hypothetical protein RND81_10G057500 [Saponaria officinalis]|uniref:Uncharacterized protein n=1 Tax=Saponaria officinalis TaxID=3572 RepID=A0AAW1I0U8_SAPOF
MCNINLHRVHITSYITTPYFVIEIFTSNLHIKSYSELEFDTIKNLGMHIKSPTNDYFIQYNQHYKKTQVIYTLSIKITNSRLTYYINLTKFGKRRSYNFGLT